MVSSKLYALEDSILSAYEKVKGKSNISIQDEFIMNSILMNYTQSYLFKKTFLGSSLFKRDDGHTYVGLLTNGFLESQFLPIEASAFLASNFDYIDEKAKNYDGGFSQYCVEHYNGNATFEKTFEEFNNNVYVNINSLLKDYPNARIPSSALIEISSVIFSINEGHREYLQDNNKTKITHLSLEEIKNSDLGNKILSELCNEIRYEAVFEDSLIIQKINLSEKSNYRIERYEFDDQPEKILNELTGFKYKRGDIAFSKIFDYLDFEGLKYIKHIHNTSSIIAHNHYGIAAVLSLNKNFSDTENYFDKIKWMSSMATSREFRGNNIAFSLFEHMVIEESKNRNIIFMTNFSENGSKYLEKNITEFIENKGYYNIVEARDRDFGLKLVKILYGNNPIVEHEEKSYRIRKVDDPYSEFFSLMRLYKSSLPKINPDDSIDSIYNKIEQRNSLGDKIYSYTVANLLAEEVKLEEKKDTRKINNKIS